MKKFRIPQEVGIAAVVLIVGLIISLMNDHFATVSNMGVLLLNGSVVLFLALGQTIRTAYGWH